MMHWTYDMQVGALYFRVADLAPASQRELDPGAVLDIAADGSVVGVEVFSRSGREVLIRGIHDLGLAEIAETLIIEVLGRQAAGALEVADSGESATASAEAIEPSPITFHLQDA